ncbi:MAG: alpha/beta hydrolase [Alphaproteobacteria bacterium]|nr:alpha/beta hydrolase [Alphaproteobacteria bacterium]
MRPPLRELGVEGMRARGKAIMGAPAPDPDVTYRDIEIKGPNGPVPTRIFTPKGSSPKGIYIHVHAGGYIMFGGLDTMTNSNIRIAKETGCVVVAPDFRLPPEHPFPAAVEDCWATVSWVGGHAKEIGGDPGHIGIGGGCTGGNIAAVMALMARDARAPKLAAQYLSATVFDCRCDYASFEENGNGYNLSADDDRYVIEVYLKYMENRWDWRASPILAPSVKDVAPAYIYVGEWDVLRDESKAYANRLRDAGVPVTLVVQPEESHAPGPGSAAAVSAAMTAFLRDHLTPKARAK